MNKQLIFALLAGCMAFAPAARATAILTLDPPNGAISGLPGTTVGWGFTFSNNADFALITGTEFCSSASTASPSVVLGCIPLSSYTDIAGSIFNPIGPSPDSTFVTESFNDSDPLNPTGIGSFAIDPGAVGTTSGFILLTYDLYNDANLDTEISSDNFVTAAASVSAVPEPVFWPLLLGVGLAAVLWKRRNYKLD